VLPQHSPPPPMYPVWDNNRIGSALAAAHRHANRWMRHGGRDLADRDDLRQDILVAIVERAPQYDATQSAWTTFVGLLARHVVADRTLAESSDRRTVLVPIDLEAWDKCAKLSSITQPDDGDGAVATAQRIDLEALVDDLPSVARQTLLLLMQTEGEIATAQRLSGRSRSAFYRSVDDLHLWLRAAGLGMADRTRGKIAPLDR